MRGVNQRLGTKKTNFLIKKFGFKQERDMIIFAFQKEDWPPCGDYRREGRTLSMMTVALIQVREAGSNLTYD